MDEIYRMDIYNIIESQNSIRYFDPKVGEGVQ
jgi:hypothetical protein